MPPPFFIPFFGPVTPEAQVPSALIDANPQYGVMGSIVQLDGRRSSDTENLPLTYSWVFVSTPIGSLVAASGFRTLDTDTTTGSPSFVSFSPDIVGNYVIGLTVNNGTFSSLQYTQQISIRAILVPVARGLVPDGKFIWSYLRDVWQSLQGKEVFEVLWSAIIQIVGMQMLKLWEIDYNKSIRDIQDTFQRGWLDYEPEFFIDQPNISFIIGPHQAGNDAVSVIPGLAGEVVIISATEIYVVSGPVLSNPSGDSISLTSSLNVGNIGTYVITGQNSKKSGYRLAASTPIPFPTADQITGSPIEADFSVRSVNWSIPALPVGTLPGDVCYFNSGPNAGIYQIVSIIGTLVVVDRPPPAFSDSTTSETYLIIIIRPNAFTLSAPPPLVTDTVAINYNSALNGMIPGRVVVVGGQTYTLIQASTDMSRPVPVTLMRMTESSVPAGQVGQFWRTPHTLISQTQNFEELGVCSGDLLEIDITNTAGQRVALITTEVIGVDGNAAGFVLTNVPVQPAVVPSIPDDYFVAINVAFGIGTVSFNNVGQIQFDSVAQAAINAASTVAFQRAYWNQLLTTASVIQVGNYQFNLVPRRIVRNRYLPVDSTLLSIPALQQYIKQPNINEVNGGFVQTLDDGSQVPVSGLPVVLTENSDYVIDDELAFSGTILFDGGTSTLHIDNFDFIDRNIVPGDQFIVSDPEMVANTYTILQILSTTDALVNQVLLNSPLGNPIQARVQLVRARKGSFIRFIPGGFSVQNPIPNRLWAEMSYFDNGPNIENNFGILVGLKQSDLADLTLTATYRQAVAGLLYAYTNGSAQNRVRLGLQILLGLPFAEANGVITSIANDYTLDTSGNPVQGQMVVEDVDAAGNLLGTQRIYTYPVSDVSPLAGVAINPATGKTYAVGDTVSTYSILSNGVALDDYLNNPLVGPSAIQLLQQYQSYRVRVNADVFQAQELALVSSFLRQITPAYLAYQLQLELDEEDPVTVEDAVIIQDLIPAGVLVDDAATGLPTALIADLNLLGGSEPVLLDNGPYWTRRVGSDLVTTASSDVVTSATGGFLNPLAIEVFESPLCQVGDTLVIYGGPNAGIYPITSITNTTATLPTAPAFGFTANMAQQFAIMRPLVGGLLHSAGTATTTLHGTTVNFSVGGLRTDGVMPGDRLIVSGSLRPYTIIAVNKVGSSWNQVVVSPALDAALSTVPYRIYRDMLVDKPSVATFPITVSAPNLFTTSSPWLQALLDPGDLIQVQEPDLLGVTVLDPFNGYITPALPNGSYTVAVMKKKPGWSFATRDLFNPGELFEARLVQTTDDATAMNGSPNITLTSYPNPTALNVVPGDFFVFTDHTNATVDVGYGAGVYPIAQVTSSMIVLTVNVSNNETNSWQILRRA